ncbi:hypothetical protein GCM10010401_04980 [Rarobacter faecitabidus]
MDVCPIVVDYGGGRVERTGVDELRHAPRGLGGALCHGGGSGQSYVRVISVPDEDSSESEFFQVSFAVTV